MLAVTAGLLLLLPPFLTGVSAVSVGVAPRTGIKVRHGASFNDHTTTSTGCSLPSSGGGNATADDAVTYPANGDCTTFTLPVAVNRTAWLWDGPRWTDDYGLADFLAKLGSANPYSEDQLWNTAGGAYTATHDIAATLCVPRDTTGGRSGTVLLASHGLGHDQQYWNVPVEPGTHNFAQHALSQGYSVFLYDRLGAGLSAKTSGFDAKAIVALEVQAEMVRAVRDGSALRRPAADKVVLVSHAYSAFVTSTMLTLYPDVAVDAVVLEGLGYKFADRVPEILNMYAPRTAATVDSDRFGWADAGVVTWTDKFTNVLMNHNAGSYNESVLEWDESNKSPFSPLELLTQATMNVNATDYAGPTLLINARHDALACDGWCTLADQAALRDAWGSASPVESFLVEDCGQSLALCRRAPEVFSRIFDFLKANLK